MTDKTLRWMPVIISIVVVVVTTAIAWGSLYVRADRNQSDIHDACDRLIVVENAIPEIETHLEWIKLALLRMEEK